MSDSPHAFLCYGVDLDDEFAVGDWNTERIIWKSQIREEHPDFYDDVEEDLDYGQITEDLEEMFNCALFAHGYSGEDRKFILGIKEEQFYHEACCGQAQQVDPLPTYYEEVWEEQILQAAAYLGIRLDPARPGFIMACTYGAYVS